MSALLSWAFAAILAFGFAAIVYSQRNVSLPNRVGKGGYGLLLLTIAGGVLAVWAIGAMFGVNIFSMMSAQLIYGLSHGSAFHRVGTVVLYGAITYLAGVCIFNTYKYGRSVV